jgi:hypothetical protein
MTVLLATILVLGAGTAAAQELVLSVTPRGFRYTVSLELTRYSGEDILASLSEGLRAEVNHQIRIYRKARGPFAFLGDRLVEQANPSLEARWDIFSRSWVIIGPDGAERHFRDREEFLQAFLSFPEYLVKTPITDPSAYYILAQSNVRSTKLVPPFSILSALFLYGQATTSWIRGEFAVPSAPSAVELLRK